MLTNTHERCTYLNRSTPKLKLNVAVAVVVAILLSSGCQAQSTKQTPPSRAYKYTNKLINETSPYLLQHAHNPVNWYPWGAEALDKSKRENKPIFLSIGYSACHWCHVMEREDFENEEVAKLLNDNFVCIKVDREQRPDIDSQYMLAVQMMTRSGGWPLSVFLTPERKPFFGGTYFPRPEFLRLLNRVTEVYTTQPDKLRESADRVAEAMASASKSERAGNVPISVLRAAANSLKGNYDSVNGGFSPKPKFPQAPNLAFLLSYFRKTGDKTVLQMVTNTLDHIANGGIYDQIGGGFHRYSTDSLWRVPHFEKMLYDQALLVPIYLDAYQITHKPRYKQVVQETLSFLIRELLDKDGGFYSSLDADSEGEEGKFYLWTPTQLEEVLGQDARLFAELYGVTATGDLEGKSVLHIAKPAPANISPRLETMRQKLLNARAKRIRPHTDDKVLTSWNGLMLVAFARAYIVLDNPAYRDTAVQIAQFLTKRMMQSGQLLHNYRLGKADTTGLLEDYACTAYGLVSLYEATHEKKWLDAAQEMATQMTVLFEDKENGGFYATATQGDLLTRWKDALDNATPSSNGVAALVLAKLAALTGDNSRHEQARKTVEAFQSLVVRLPSALPTLLITYQAFGESSVIKSAAVVQLQTESLTAHPGTTVSARLRIRIQKGWHVNAHQPSEGYLIPTTLKLVSDNGITMLKVDYPPSEKGCFAFSKAPLSIYRGDVVLKATILIGKKAPRGKMPLTFVLSYQPCNDRACLLPTKIMTNMTLMVE